jgi:hypothetical protein
MANFTPGEVFVDGQQVNADRLNNHVASAIPLPTFISERAETDELDPIDNFLVWKEGTNTLEKIEATNIFNVPNIEVTVGTLTVKDKIIHIGELADIATYSYSNIAYNPIETRLEINMGYSPVGDIINPVNRLHIGGDTITINGILVCDSTIGTLELPQTLYMRGFNLQANATNPLHALSPVVGDVYYSNISNTIKIYTADGYVDVVTTGSGLGSTRSYTKNLNISASAWNDLDVTRFPNAYIYKTPGEITVPVGETWHYTLTLAIDNDNKATSGDWGDVIAYVDSIEVARFKINSCGGSFGQNPPGVIYARASLINADTTGGKEFKFVWYGLAGDGKIGNGGLVKGNITLDIELDADSEFKDINL